MTAKVRRRCLLVLAFACVVNAPARVLAQADRAGMTTGQLYLASCAACHGTDGIWKE